MLRYKYFRYAAAILNYMMAQRAKVCANLSQVPTRSAESAFMNTFLYPLEFHRCLNPLLRYKYFRFRAAILDSMMRPGMRLPWTRSRLGPQSSAFMKTFLFPLEFHRYLNPVLKYKYFRFTAAILNSMARPGMRHHRARS